MRDTNLIALEAAFELDPIRIDHKLWEMIDSNILICYYNVDFKRNVEDLSNENLSDIQPRAFSGFRF